MLTDVVSIRSDPTAGRALIALVISREVNAHRFDGIGVAIRSPQPHLPPPATSDLSLLRKISTKLDNLAAAKQPRSTVAISREVRGMASAENPLVGVIMGSKSDWEHMAAVAEILTEFKVVHEVRILSAHRTPDLTLEYASSAQGRGLKAIIAGAGGAAHLAGVVAAKTILPVIGVPMPTTSLNGIDSLLSIVQMPRGVPVATMAIGKAGAANAALFAVAIVALNDAALAQRLQSWRAARANELLEQKLP